MHDLVRSHLQRESVPPVLARFPLDGGALLAAFAPRGAQSLRWIAKTAYGRSACRRLRAEAEALQLVSPMAETLRLPVRLAYAEQGEHELISACLIQTPILGRPLQCRWGTAPWAEFPKPMRAALDWLQRFQQASAALAPPPLTLAALGGSLLAAAHLALESAPSLAPLLSWLPQVLTPPSSTPSVIFIHGDFWLGNLLWTGKPSSVGVIDWSGFGPGSALDDLLTWMTQMPVGSLRHPLPRLTAWPPRLFADGRARHCLRDWALRVHYDAASARYAFYLFLARRLLWELGFGLQFRDEQEQNWAREQWIPLLAWLAQHDFPDPFA